MVSERRDRIDKLEQQSERLALLNRILRHDILNNSTIIAGTVDLLEDRVDEAEQNQITAIRRANESTIKLTETAQDFIGLITTDADETAPESDTLQSTSLRDTLTDIVENYRLMYPKSTIDLDPVPSATVPADELFESLFRNLIENAIQHNDQAEPGLAIITTERSASVTVADDGPGLDDHHWQLLEGEPSLADAQDGIGLYFIRKLVDRYDGEIRVSTADPRGTEVAVTHPKA